MPNIALTERCNLNCPYCFAHDMLSEAYLQKTDITKEQLFKILNFIISGDSIKRNPPIGIGLLGGEPTLHPQIYELILFIKDFFKKEKLPYHLTIFSNGIYLNKIIDLIDENCTCLINLNSIQTIKESNWNKILNNLDLLEKKSKLNFIHLGINLYPGMEDCEFIFKVAQRYKINHLRYSYVAPANLFTSEDKIKYYGQGLILSKKFFNLAQQYNIDIGVDCNHVPYCYFSEEDFCKYEENVHLMMNSHFMCSDPVVDITPNFQASSCFGTYELVDLDRFKNYDELLDYFYENKIKKLQEINCEDEQCQKCEWYLEKQCQGGCLAFAKNKLNKIKENNNSNDSKS